MPGAAADRSVARAIDALRRGWAVELIARDGALRLLAVEGADAQSLPAFDPGASADLLISAARAQTLHLTNQREAADPEMPVLVQREPWIDEAGAMALADPVRDLATPLKGPYRTLPLAMPDAARAALRLARQAGILPAFFVTQRDVPCEAQVTAEAIQSYDGGALLAIATRARLPVAVAEEGDVSPVSGPTVGEVCCHITGAERVTSTISFHLKELRNAGLITMEKRGKYMICGVSEEAARELAAYLAGDPDEVGGDCC